MKTETMAHKTDMVFLRCFFGVIPVVLAMLLCLPPNSARAQEAEAAAEEKPEGWETRINMALNLVRGNSKTMHLNAGLLSEYHKAANELRLELKGNYGESSTTDAESGEETTETTVQNFMGSAEYKRMFWEYEYVYLNGEAFHDDPADIKYRTVVGPGVGHYFIKNEQHQLSADIGAAYMREKLLDEIDDTANLRVSQRYEIKFLENSIVWQSFEYLAAFDDFEDYHFTLEIGAEAPLTTRINLRVVFKDKYDSQPAEDKKRNDLELIAGLSVAL